MSYLIFDRLPVEIRMMVFDHLVTDKSSLGKTCLTSYNWKIITQNSFSWMLRIKSLLGQKNSQNWASYIAYHECWINTYIWNPVFNIQFAPEDQVSNTIKHLLFKKFVFIFASEGIPAGQFEPTEWFKILCSVDNLQSLQLLWNSFTINEKDITDNESAFLKVCAGGNLMAVKWMYSTFYVADNNDSQTSNNCKFRRALYQACSYNHLAVAEWLYSTLQFSPDAFRSDITPTFVNVCTSGYLSMAKWMYLTFNLTMDNIRDDDGDCAFADTCKNGHLEVLKWLHSTFNITLDFARQLNNFALAEACQYGHVNVFRWLCSTFEFTIDDATDEFDAFLSAFASGNLEILQLLHSTVHFSVDDVKSGQYQVLNVACEHEDPAMVQWLCVTFNLTVTDIRISSSLGYACDKGCLAVIQWLFSNFSLTLADIINDNNNLLNIACTNGQMHIVKWICFTYCLMLTDISIAIAMSLHNGHLNIATFLRNRYHVIGDTRLYVKCMFHSACINGSLVLAKLLYSIALFSIDEIREKEKELLCLICENGHLSIIKWLCTIFKFIPSDFISDTRCPLALAWIKGHQSLAQWLCSAFNLSTNDMCRTRYGLYIKPR